MGGWVSFRLREVFEFAGSGGAGCHRWDRVKARSRDEREQQELNITETSKQAGPGSSRRRAQAQRGHRDKLLAKERMFSVFPFRPLDH